ncbi:hypothetical protein [Gluconobacter kondonii]|uniref:hypothetical protein n=1 Tax=Gluconobacter kondonii TaxID=941463 RepID=UPI001B8B4CE0|nr:hypothetical protein [Gluconobacter kondonii]MBS1079095.1 hypothetical protein [Gluconobacter kondonii]
MNKSQIGVVVIVLGMLSGAASPYWLHHYKDFKRPTPEDLTSYMSSYTLKNEGDAAFMKKMGDAIDFADASERGMRPDDYVEYKNTLKLCDSNQDFFDKNEVRCNFTQRKEDDFQKSNRDFRPRNSFYFYEKFLGACYGERTVGSAIKRNCLSPY